MLEHHGFPKNRTSSASEVVVYSEKDRADPHIVELSLFDEPVWKMLEPR